ncbi:MAG: DUF2070 family protein [Candidatus Micrarchaeia archaeon]
MTKNIKKSVALTGYLISLPKTRYLLTGIFIIGIIFGVLLNFGKYSGIELLTISVINGIYLLVIPALFSAMAIKLMIRKIEFKKIAGTALIGEIIYGITYFLSSIIWGYNEMYSQSVIFIGSAFVFVIWYYIARIIFGVNLKALVSAIVQLIFYAGFLTGSSLIFTENTIEQVLFKLYLSSFLLLFAIYLFFRIINAPMKRTFGYSSIDAFSMFMGQWLYGKKDIEKAFQEVGETSRTLLYALIFEREKDKKVFLVPFVHFGPFGNLGGSDFSNLIAKEIMKKYAMQTFVFHAPVTHDLNPSSSSEINKIINSFDSLMKECRFEKSKIGFSHGKFKESIVDNLWFENGNFISLSRAPKVTEDINFGLGLSLIKTGEKYSKQTIVVDQHNAETGEITSFEPGSIEGFNYMNAVEKSFEKNPEMNSLLCGFSQRNPTHGAIGGAGIKIAVFSTKPEYVLILIDSNGITPQCREIIIREVQNLGKKHNRKWNVGVYTTDTHSINAVQGVVNPLTEDVSILKEIKTCALGAYFDMKPAKVYIGKKWFDINVLGSKQSIEIVSTVNSIIAVAKVAAPIIIFGSVLAIIWVLSKL